MSDNGSLLRLTAAVAVGQLLAGIVTMIVAKHFIATMVEDIIPSAPMGMMGGGMDPMEMLGGLDDFGGGEGDIGDFEDSRPDFDDLDG